MLAEWTTVVRLKDGPDIQHGTGPFERRSHPTSFHAVSYRVPARTLDALSGNRISSSQIAVKLHSRSEVRDAFEGGVPMDLQQLRYAPVRFDLVAPGQVPSHTDAQFTGGCEDEAVPLSKLVRRQPTA